MRRIVVAILLVSLITVLLPCNTPAFADHPASTDMISIERTTDREIRFHNIDWATTSKELREELIKRGFLISNYYARIDGQLLTVDSSMASSFGVVGVLPVKYSTTVKVDEYVAENVSGYYRLSLGKVAGHNVDRVSAKYMKSSGRMYEIALSFASNKIISPEERFADLKIKLSSLYGDPIEFSNEMTLLKLGRFKYEYSLWLGANRSGVYLLRSYALDKHKSESDSVSITYGLLNSYDWILSEEHDLEETDQKTHDEAIQQLESDIQGL